MTSPSFPRMRFGVLLDLPVAHSTPSFPRETSTQYRPSYPDSRLPSDRTKKYLQQCTSDGKSRSNNASTTLSSQGHSLPEKTWLATDIRVLRAKEVAKRAEKSYIRLWRTTPAQVNSKFKLETYDAIHRQTCGPSPQHQTLRVEKTCKVYTADPTRGGLRRIHPAEIQPKTPSSAFILAYCDLFPSVTGWCGERARPHPPWLWKRYGRQRECLFVSKKRIIIACGAILS